MRLANRETSLSESNANLSLSVVDAMNQLGVCSKEQTSDWISPVSYLLKMRSSKGTCLLEKTVETHFKELCQPPSSKSLEKPIKDLKRSLPNFSSQESPCLNCPSDSGTQKFKCAIPPYTIEVRDFGGKERAKEIAESLFVDFKNPKALPLSFASCMESKITKCEITYGWRKTLI